MCVCVCVCVCVWGGGGGVACVRACAGGGGGGLKNKENIKLYTPSVTSGSSTVSAKNSVVTNLVCNHAKRNVYVHTKVLYNEQCYCVAVIRSVCDKCNNVNVRACKSDLSTCHSDHSDRACVCMNVSAMEGWYWVMCCVYLLLLMRANVVS